MNEYEPDLKVGSKVKLNPDLSPLTPDLALFDEVGEVSEVRHEWEGSRHPTTYISVELGNYGQFRLSAAAFLLAENTEST